MKAAEKRRKEMITMLLASKEPISGGALAQHFGKSRQIIVQDIAILKGQGYDIIPTHYGYVIHGSPLVERAFKFKHTTEQTEEELNTIVDLGGTVVDVYVWHRVYGKISAPLNIFSRMHVRQFLEGVRTGKSSELMNVTGGYHYHTVRADSEEVMDQIEKELTEKGFIVPET
jgi:transcriptional regulator of NAD metabolism